MNALYSCCIVDPWLDVAKNLYKKNKIKPVYWIGWNENNEEQLIANIFSDIIFHEIVDAWRGIFPEQVNDNYYLSNKIISENVSHELLAIKMMDRLDSDRKSFNFIERQRFYRNLVKNWINVVNQYEVDVVISPSIPHRVFDYALYVVCQYYNIKFISIKMTSIKDLIVFTKNIFNMPGEIEAEYNKTKKSNTLISLTQDIDITIDKIKGDYRNAEPGYMKKQKETLFNNTILSRVKKHINNPYIIIKRFFELKNASRTYLKEYNKSPENSQLSNYQVRVLKKRGRKYKSCLKDYYESLCVPFDKDKKNIFLALHYQPEETSCPSGGIFHDQILMAELLAKAIPTDWIVYVKEHKSQFHPLMEGETSRDKYFYDTLSTINKVRLISINVNPFSVIDNAVAVATMTGTIGWESILRGKPVFVFGNAWYRQCEGAFYINNEDDLKNAIGKTENGYSINEHFVKCFIKACTKVGVFAYHYKGRKEISNISHYGSVGSLARGIISCCSS